MFRFFTVYGPWGRPDLAPSRFADAILNGRPIDIYNHGDMYRDFTYVEDLVRAIRLLIDAAPVRPASKDDILEGDSLSPVAPFRIVNIGKFEQGAAARFRRCDRGGTGDQGRPQLHANAKGRRLCDVGGCDIAAKADGLSPTN